MVTYFHRLWQIRGLTPCILHNLYGCPGLFLGAVGLARPWELRRYSGDGLALLTGRRWAYGYVHTDRFLAGLAKAGADQSLTTVVAHWGHQLWGQQRSYYITQIDPHCRNRPH